MKPTYIALVDCNSFYCSCERVFNPAIVQKPVIVLSNNDGCAVSRSDEAKALGIAMGAPFFEIKKLCKAHNVHVFSSNYTLYGDMSHRVMQTLSEMVPEMEIYSIDEAFVTLQAKTLDAIKQEVFKIKHTIYQNTGIPVSIGVGPTKVLAKAANDFAKDHKKVTHCVHILCEPRSIEQTLKKIPAGEIWGIGRKSAQKLSWQNIHTAHDLTKANDHVVQKLLSIVGLRIAKELRGEPCLSLGDQPESPKQIIATRSFGSPVTELQDLRESIATHVTRAARKLRQKKLTTKHIRVMILTNRFSEEDFYFNSQGMTLRNGSCCTNKLISYAFDLLDKIYKPGLRYKKSGIFLYDLVPSHFQQMDLFQSHDSEQDERLMKTLDRINERYGRDTLFFAACGIQPFWQMSCRLKTPAYTTRWSELLKVETRNPH